MGKKRVSRPAWWKNTFFWFGFLLLCLGAWGLFTNEGNIRDPGQKFETGLVGIYFVGALVMLVNGWLTHIQATQFYDEATDGAEPSKSNSEKSE